MDFSSCHVTTIIFRLAVPKNVQCGFNWDRRKSSWASLGVVVPLSAHALSKSSEPLAVLSSVPSGWRTVVSVWLRSPNRLKEKGCRCTLFIYLECHWRIFNLFINHNETSFVLWLTCGHILLKRNLAAMKISNRVKLKWCNSNYGLEHGAEVPLVSTSWNNVSYLSVSNPTNSLRDRDALRAVRVPGAAVLLDAAVGQLDHSPRHGGSEGEGLGAASRTSRALNGQKLWELSWVRNSLTYYMRAYSACRKVPPVRPPNLKWSEDLSRGPTVPLISNNQKEMSILTCSDNVINRNVQFDDLILILFIYSNFDDLFLILVIFLILMILF